jgi:hypothetical protein
MTMLKKNLMMIKKEDKNKLRKDKKKEIKNFLV